LLELPLEVSTFCPSLDPIAILQVIAELALIGCALALVSVSTNAMRHISAPLPDIDISVAMLEEAFAGSAVLLPLSRIGSPVGPFLNSKAIPIIAKPLTCVDRS